MPASGRPLFLGIDGGGTKTECRLAAVPSATARQAAGHEVSSAGIAARIEILGSGSAGPSNPRTIGIEAACAAIDCAVDDAFRNAHVPRNPAAACVAGLAGVGDERLWTAILQGLTARGIAEHVDVVADYELPLAAAAPDGIGISLISGTGSVAFGRNRKGATARAGGWGYLFGDLGSAYAIAREALQEAARADDGCRMRTSLSRALAQFFGVATIRDVADLVYRSQDPRRLIASAARVVFAERERGDLLAQNLIERARGGLGDLLFALADRLALDGEPFTLALAGGVLTGNNAFAEELIGSAAMNLEAAPRAVLVSDPAVGGVHLALRRYEAAHRGPHGPGR